MPHTTAIIEPRGPMIAVHVGVSLQRADALLKAGQKPPTHIVCNLLIDTGASMTSIDENIIKKLGLTPTGNIPMHTPSTGDVPYQCNTYDISMIIAGSPNTLPKIIGALPVIESNFGAQAIDGLLGRDVLSMSRLIYSGVDNLVMLSII